MRTKTWFVAARYVFYLPVPRVMLDLNQHSLKFQKFLLEHGQNCEVIVCLSPKDKKQLLVVVLIQVFRSYT